MWSFPISLSATALTLLNTDSLLGEVPCEMSGIRMAENEVFGPLTPIPETFE